MLEQIQTLQSFVPTPILRTIYHQAKAGKDLQQLLHPYTQCVSAAVLFADISGFTSLTEMLTQQGSRGAEELTTLLNLYFSRMIIFIESYRGQVVGLAGDAITAVFFADDMPDSTLTSAVLYAAYAAMDMQTAMADFQHLSTSVGEASLALKIGIGAGEILAAHIGGYHQRWQYLIAGDGIEQAANAEQQAHPGMIILSPQAATLTGLQNSDSTSYVTIRNEDSSTSNRYQDSLSTKRLDRETNGHHTKGSPSDTNRDQGIILSLASSFPRPQRSLPYSIEWENIPSTLLNHVQEILQNYVPSAITKRLVAGRQTWLAELRHMTVVFIGLGGLDYRSPDILHHLQTSFVEIEDIIHRYEGNLNKIAVDDKGTVLLVLFGAPPLAHEDDPARALACAYEIQQHFSQTKYLPNQSMCRDMVCNASAINNAIPCSDSECEQLSKRPMLRIAIGVTTDTVFVGPVGSPNQCEYTVMGDYVNLASRLMQLAGAGVILCDHSTYKDTHRYWKLEPLKPVQVKGKAQPVRIYRFTGIRVQSPSGATIPLVSREHELAALTNYLEQVERGFGCVVSLSGDGGLGKTRLIQEFLTLENQRESVSLTLQGTAHSIGQQTPYLVWRDVLTSYFGLHHINTPEKRVRRVIEQACELDPDIEQRIPLLNDILDLDLPETSATRGLSPRKRRDNLTFLVTQLLLAWAKKNTLIIVLDDMHWADSLSWELTLDIARVILLHPVMILVSYRSPGPGGHRDWSTEKRASLTALSNLSHNYGLCLSPLDKRATERFVVSCLGEKTVSPQVISWLIERTQGNPFFIEETVHLLHEQSLLMLNEQGTWILKDEHDLNTIPSTLKGIIQSHLDRLQTGTNLTCKVASVIGRIFPARVVDGIYPMPEERPNLLQHLETLAQENITPLLSYEPELRYQFKSALTQDVAYSSLLLAQRQELHRAVAEWYEREYATNIDPYLSILAEHYNRSEEWERFLEFAEQAGRLAAKNYANAEALSYYNQAIDVLISRPTIFPPSLHKERLLNLLLARAEVYAHSSQTTLQEQDLQEINQLIEHMDNPQYRALAHMKWANYYQTTNNYDAANKEARSAIELAKQLSNYQMLGECMNLLAHNSELQGNYQQVLWWGFQALDYCHEVGDRVGEAQSLYFIGIANAELGDYTQATEYHQKALNIRRAIDDRWGEATSLNQIGNIHKKLGKPRDALEAYLKALEIRRSIGDRSGEAFTLLSIGNTYQVLGDLSLAQSYQQEALAIWREIGNQFGEATLLIDMCDVATAMGKFEVAQRYANQGLELARTLGNRQLQAQCLAKWGNAGREIALLIQSDICRQRKHAEQQMSGPNIVTSAMRMAFTMARKHHRAAYDLARELGLRRLEAYALHHLGEWEWSWGSSDMVERAHAAIEYWSQAADIRQEIGEQELVRATRCRQAQALAEIGELDHARALVEEVWEVWGTNPPTGEEEGELREGYLALYKTWRMLGEHDHAFAALAWAYQGIQDRAFHISDPVLRDSFLNNVSVNRNIIEAWNEAFEMEG